MVFRGTPHPLPGASIFADPLNAFHDARLRPDALGDRGQLALFDQLGQDRRLAPGIPRGALALRVIDIHLHAKGIVWIDGISPELFDSFDLLVGGHRKTRLLARLRQPAYPQD